MSSLAQEESRSISENTTWGKRKRFAEGKASVGYKHFLGYDKDFIINEDEAKIVRLIYGLFISGLSFTAIGKELENKGLKTSYGKNKWHTSTIKSILTNEKYMGDALLQKEYMTDFLQKTKKVNEGEIPQYYVEGHHKAIISPEQFDFVQLEIQKRKEQRRKSGNSIFSSKIKCGQCGAWYVPKTWHSNDKYRNKIYICTDKYKNKGKPCRSPHFTEYEIKDMFIRALNKLTKVKKAVTKEMNSLIDDICSTTDLEMESRKLEREIEDILYEMNSLIKVNANTAQNKEEYLKRENQIRLKYQETRDRLTDINNKIELKQNKKTFC